jgi:hypothetical protein
MDFKEMCKKIGEMWQDTSAEDRKKYVSLQLKDLERYKHDIAVQREELRMFSSAQDKEVETEHILPNSRMSEEQQQQEMVKTEPVREITMADVKTETSSMIVAAPVAAPTPAAPTIEKDIPIPASIRPPRSAFNFFYKKEVKPLQHSPLIAHFSFIDAAFHLSSKWHDLSEQEKGFYQSLAGQDLARYNKEVALYK